MIATAMSGSDGRFTLTTALDVLELTAEAIGYSTATRATRAPSRDLQFVLAPQSIVRGRVLELKTQAPVAGVRVAAVERGGAMSPPRWVLSQDDGGFQVAGLAAGTYEMIVTSATWRGQPETIRIATGEVLDKLELHASPATTLAARIEIDGQPCMAGAVAASGPVEQREPLGPDGSVELDGLVPGRYLVTYNCSEAVSEGRPISLGGDQYIEMASQPLTRTFAISRREDNRTPNDAAVGNVIINVRGDDAAAGSVELINPTRAEVLHGERSQRGVVFSNVPIGAYIAFFERAPAVGAQAVLERAGQIVEVTLEPPESRVITGRVIGDDGQPIPDIWVRARNSQYPSEEFAKAGVPALTDAQGDFSLGGLFAQPYDLTAEGLGARAELEGIVGGARDVTLTLTAATR